MGKTNTKLKVLQSVPPFKVGARHLYKPLGQHISQQGMRFAPANFGAFSTIETRRFCGPELSSIQQTAPEDLNS
jgi:hypothetical protein